jgi:PleD family two-component response regulator
LAGKRIQLPFVQQCHGSADSTRPRTPRLRDNIEIEARAQLLAVAKGLEERAATDALTGVSNRFEFNETLGREMARAKRHKTPLSLIIYDHRQFWRCTICAG